jgi:hypothetical protein
MVAVIEWFQISACEAEYAGSNPVSHPQQLNKMTVHMQTG